MKSQKGNENLNITAVLWLQCWWLLQCHETVEQEPVSPNRTTALCCRWQCEQQAYDIGKANPCSQKRPCFCLLEGWSSYKLSPFYFYFFLFFFFQDSAGEAGENIEKVVNLELVFGYHLKLGNGPKVIWVCCISLAIFLVGTQSVPCLLDAKKKWTLLFWKLQS